MAAKKDVTGIVPRKDVAIPPPQFQTVETRRSRHK